MKFNESDGSYVAYHSLNLTEHEYKRFGEIDFLICCPMGIFVLEVKGGGVSCSDGEWFYENRQSKKKGTREGPFNQAESALHGLNKKLIKRFGKGPMEKFTIGYGVIFPDCEWRAAGTEWDPHTLADARTFKNLESWLRKLFAYWRAKDGGKRKPSIDVLRNVQRYLRPNFEAVIPLYSQARSIDEKIDQLTEDQMNMVDVVAVNPRVLCSGGAGTGKTYMAMELARRWTAQGMDVLLTCRSPWLKRFLEAHFTMPKLTVSLVDSCGIACRRAGLVAFDAMIVDEGQDLFEMEYLEKMDSVVTGGLTTGRWCIFHDVNNQSGLFGSYDPDALEYLTSLAPTLVPLSTNCRNTRVILEEVQSSLNADMGTRGVGEGPKVKVATANSQENAALILKEEILEIVEHGELHPGGLTILSPVDINESCVRFLPPSIRNQIRALDEFSVKDPSHWDRIGFSKIANFKGLENDAIIVVDLPQPGVSGKSVALHYVAMSRSRAILSLIYSE